MVLISSKDSAEDNQSIKYTLKKESSKNQLTALNSNDEKDDC